MSKDTGSKHTVFTGVHEYFINNVLPDNIQARVVHITASSSYKDNHDQTFILVKSGTGKIIINGLEHAVKADTLINLGPFHRFRFIPAKGDCLEIVIARMNAGTYMYMISNPYYKCEVFDIPSEAPVVHLTGLSAEIAHDSMNGLLTESKSQSADKIHLCFCYMADLFGLVIDKIPK